MAIVFMRDIERAASQITGIKIAALKCPIRRQRLARVRQIVMMLCREMTSHSLTRIGNEFNRDHTTVLHATTRIKSLASKDPSVAELIETIRTRALEISREHRLGWVTSPRVTADSGSESSNAKATKTERMSAVPAE